MFQEEILDETDLYVDNMQTARINAAEVIKIIQLTIMQLMHTQI